MVYRLLYISKAKRDLNDQDLGQILAVSRANNSKMDITGLLLYLDREFLQVLEGGKQEVDSLFKKISSDDRHFTVKCLQAVEVDDRLFGDWSMAYLPISPDEKRKLMGEGDFFATFSPSNTSDQSTKSLTKFITSIANKMVARAKSKMASSD